ncbi:MAG: biopolymer transporter ExbD [Elusimicrobia bacterium]|nr:biopolymer transporter ExbD [Elusimicrobiota bacterium]
MRIHNPEKGIMAEMNMIPLIDVALILLIIFMVITPYLVQSQMSVQLPKSSGGEKSSEDNVIRIQIEPSGAVSVEGKKMKMSQVEQELVLRLSKSSKKTVLVQADRTVPIETVVKVFDTAKKLGVGKLGIAVSNQK